jgi:hypothetical protein
MNLSRRGRSDHILADPFRRRLLLASAVLPVLMHPATAEEIIELTWQDLVPEGEPFIPPSLRGLVEHDNAGLMSQQPASTGVRTDWNGKTVSLSGYIVPIDYDGTGVTAFILVPFVGACVHVPPPPANQLVMVTTDRPYESAGLFEPVRVTGLFGTAATATELANIGYALSAEQIEPYS